MPESMSGQSRGIVLVVAASVAWSTAPLFVRILPFDPFTILFWRGVFAGLAILTFLFVMQGKAAFDQLLKMNRGGLIFAAISGFSMLMFVPALQHTSVANVAIILATAPFAAAALAFVWFREVPRLRTVLASAAAMLGVSVTVGGNAAVADLVGIAFAVLTMLSIAGMAVAARRYRETPLVAAAAMSNFMGSAASLLFAPAVLSISPHFFMVLAAFGVLQVALGLTLFVLGSRHLPAAQSSLIGTLETPLMPFWIWLVFSDAPTSSQLIGGAIVLAAVIVDILGDLRSQQRQVLTS